jgi:NTE family protein
VPTAFVLAGGSSLGAIEAGMLEALYERHIEADMFVGASAGALNAGFAAAHPQTVEAAHALQDAWRASTRREVFPLSPLTALRAFLGRSNHLVSIRGLKGLVEQRLGSLGRLEQARTKLGVVVTDLLDGEERLLDSGPAVPALMASAAIPAIYPPVKIDGRLYVDGGVADNTPISQALELGADRIYVLPTGVSVQLEHPPATALEMAVHAFNLLLHARLRQEIEALRDRCTLVVLPPPWPLTVLPSDFSRADELIRAGLLNAREALAEPHPAGAPTDRAIARMQDPGGTADTPSPR